MFHELGHLVHLRGCPIIQIEKYTHMNDFVK